MSHDLFQLLHRRLSGVAESFYRPIGMAFETIELDAGSDVATGTKVLVAVIVNAHDIAAFIGCRMTIDTGDNTVLLGADAVIHGQVTLVQQILHMIGPHIAVGSTHCSPFGVGTTLPLASRLGPENWLAARLLIDHSSKAVVTIRDFNESDFTD
jgi:hypothetical protein